MLSVDPFLAAHMVAPLMLEIGPRLSPVSIRDQMVRAALAVDRALHEGLIGRARPLFVVGAGVAGASAAIRASGAGVPTVLVDRDQAFSRQRGCFTRWVDPTQYDWPALHAEEGVYPWKGPAVELPFCGSGR
jgi:hypothetical protein